MMNPVRDFIRSLKPFLGVNPARLLPIIEKVRLEFLTYEKDDVIITPETDAKNLLILLKGEVVMERVPVEGVRVQWKAREGQAIDLPALFSLTQRHNLIAYANGRVDIVSADRAQIRNLYETEPIILLNLLNSLGLAASRQMIIPFGSTIRMWLQTLGGLAESYPVRIFSTPKRIAELLSLDQSFVRKELKNLHHDGIIRWNDKEDSIILYQTQN